LNPSSCDCVTTIPGTQRGRAYFTRTCLPVWWRDDVDEVEVDECGTDFFFMLTGVWCF
jgi:hypothetical protein